MAKKSAARTAFEIWDFWQEAATVMALRTMKIAAGGAAANAEVSRMVTEKINSAVELQVRAMTGGLGFTLESAANKASAHYRAKVRANKRRLGREL